MEIEKISIYRREDFFKGFPKMLVMLIEYLIENDQVIEAKGIFLRNNIDPIDLVEEDFEKLNQIYYSEE